MPNRFPFLKSKREPFGVVEQFGVAVTIHPDADSSPEVGRSWFGTTLLKDQANSLVFTYTNEDGTKVDTISGHDNITKAYADGKLLCTAYDSGVTYLRINVVNNTGEVEGSVRLKGHCDLFVNNNRQFRGRHLFRYEIVLVGNEWLIKKWSLRKEATTTGVTEPIDKFLDALI